MSRWLVTRTSIVYIEASSAEEAIEIAGEVGFDTIDEQAEQLPHDPCDDLSLSLENDCP